MSCQRKTGISLQRVIMAVLLTPLYYHIQGLQSFYEQWINPKIKPITSLKWPNNSYLAYVQKYISVFLLV